MTEPQRATLARMLDELDQAEAYQHGGAVGADAELHELVRQRSGGWFCTPAHWVLAQSVCSHRHRDSREQRGNTRKPATAMIGRRCPGGNIGSHV